MPTRGATPVDLTNAVNGTADAAGSVAFDASTAVPESVPERGPTPVQQHPPATKLIGKTGLKSASSGLFYVLE